MKEKEIDMNSIEYRVAKAIYNFSKHFGIDIPTTTDLGEWWRVSLKQMHKEDVYSLYEEFVINSTPMYEPMKMELIARKHELEAERIESYE
ncbi:hypothetical protein [Bacillus sp. FSL K6-3431]|uniref:hypothetical protein n=1 Tax=Bacillus sp. FSL K6-3431 TaxID=2921500 RepID=UPI0030F7328A